MTVRKDPATNAITGDLVIGAGRNLSITGGTLNEVTPGSVGLEIFALDGAEQISLSRVQGWSETGSLVALDIAAPNELWSLSLAATATEAYVRVRSEGGEGYADLRHNGLAFWDTANTGTLNLLRPAVVTGTVLVELPSASGTLALTSGTVNLTGNQTIAGNKTHSGTLAATAQPGQNGTGGSVTATDALTVGGGDARYRKSYTARRTTNLLRADTTTLTDDPTLQIPNVEVGIYNVRLRFQTFDNVLHGFKWDLGGTATFASIGRAPLLQMYSTLRDLSAGIKSGESMAPWSNSSRTIMVEGMIQVTAAGSITFRWAQHTSSATETVLFGGASMELKEL